MGNGDGIIDPDEWIHCEGLLHAFHLADKNHDGQLSQEEWVDEFDSRAGFSTFDTDKDGHIGPAEYIKFKPHKYFTPKSRALPPVSDRRLGHAPLYYPSLSVRSERRNTTSAYVSTFWSGPL